MERQTESMAMLGYSAIVGWMLAMGANPPAAANDFERALSAYEQGRYQTAFKLVKTSAEQGQVQAQHVLGIMYSQGLGVQSDEYSAFDWCKRAAENGVLEAQYQLGIMYLQGEGVTEDHDQAHKWLWMAADRGYPQASQVLQYIYSDDFTVGC